MKIQSFKSKMLVISFGCLAMLGNQACTTSEVLETVGAVALVGAVVAAGVVGGGGGAVDNGCGYDSLESVSATTDGVASSPSLGAALAQKFNFTEESANHLVTALQSAKSGDTTDLVNLGVTSQEALLLANGKMMSEQGLQNLAGQLGQNVLDTKEMVQAIMNGAAQQKSSLCMAASESSKTGTIPAICR
jgi:hypothetical protein